MPCSKRTGADSLFGCAGTDPANLCCNSRGDRIGVCPPPLTFIFLDSNGDPFLGLLCWVGCLFRKLWARAKSSFVDFVILVEFPFGKLSGDGFGSDLDIPPIGILFISKRDMYRFNKYSIYRRTSARCTQNCCCTRRHATYLCWPLPSWKDGFTGTNGSVLFPGLFFTVRRVSWRGSRGDAVDVVDAIPMSDRVGISESFVSPSLHTVRVSYSTLDMSDGIEWN